jgi:biofilm PGA synthesis lipoprotein PgaB
MIWILALSLVVPVVQTSSANSGFAVLAYHDVVDNSRSLTFDAITARNLALHFEWLRSNGYHIISIDDILAANRGKRPLPPHAVLLTFDDGFRSFYTRVFPLLLAFKYPAVLSVVGSWLEPPPLSRVRHGTETVPRETFISWWELKVVQASGLVEVASHTYGLHTTTLINPMGGEGPAITRRFFRSGVQSLPDKLLYSLHPPRFGDVRELLTAPYDEYVELVTGVPQSPIDPDYDPQTSGYET